MLNDQLEIKKFDRRNFMKAVSIGGLSLLAGNSLDNIVEAASPRDVYSVFGLYKNAKIIKTIQGTRIRSGESVKDYAYRLFREHIEVEGIQDGIIEANKDYNILLINANYPDGTKFAPFITSERSINSDRFYLDTFTHEGLSSVVIWTFFTKRLGPHYIYFEQTNPKGFYFDREGRINKRVINDNLPIAVECVYKSDRDSVYGHGPTINL